jgi:5-methylcytosine-specific restriction endonuclease McrA
MTKWSFHCAYCGRFVSWGADHFTPFASGEALDPPDDEYLCKRCARREYVEAIRERRLPTHWHPAKWEYRAAKKLGFVRAGPSGAAWTHWFAPNSLPTGYEMLEDVRVGERPA